MTEKRRMISPNFTYFKQPETVEAAEETKQGEEKEIKYEDSVMNIDAPEIDMAAIKIPIQAGNNQNCQLIRSVEVK